MACLKKEMQVKSFQPVYAVLGIFAILTAASFGSSRVSRAAVGSGGAAVTVVNTASNPVPTREVGPISVNASQTGTWTVGVGSPVSLSSDAAVAVNNAPENPVPVHEVGGSTRTPVTLAEGMFLPVNNYSETDGDFLYTVPAGKHLVLEEMNFTGYLPGGQNLVLAQLHVNNTYLAFPFVHEGESVEDEFGSGAYTEYFAYDGPLHIQVASGQKIGFKARRNANTGQGDIELSVSGYLENN